MSAVDQFSPSDQISPGTAGTVPPIGAQLGGRYTITCRLAEGTFGHTYLAKDAHLPHCPDCVVKQLKPQTSERSMQMARRMFETEARVLYDLGRHDQIPQLLAHFEQDGEFFLVQEFVDGHAISDELSPHQPWTQDQVVPLLEELFEILSFVHGKQVIHRDLKPGNLLRRRKDGKIVLIDFGAVKEVTTRFLTPPPGNTDYTIAIGTVGYIPKEQLGGRPRFSSDVFAAGMMAIQALTGVHPNAFEEDSETAEMRWKEHLLSPIHPQLAEILECMVRYDFRDRFTDAEAALRAIQALPNALRHPDPRTWQAPRTHLDPDSLPPTQPFNEAANMAATSAEVSMSASDSGPAAVPLPEPSSMPDASRSPAVSASPVVASQGQTEPQLHETDEIPNTAVSSATSVPLSTVASSMASPMASPVAASPASPEAIAPPNSASLSPPGSPYPIGTPQPRRSSPSGVVPAFGQPRPKVTGQSGLPRRTHSRIPATSRRGYRSHPAGAIAPLQLWISRSWKLLLLMGSASLVLMVVRGITLSAGSRVPSVPSLQSLHTSLLPEAEAMLETTEVEEEPVPAKVQATQRLVEADMARAQQRPDIALDRYQSALLLDGDLTEAHWGKCATYLDQRQLEAALEACHDAIATNPNHAPSWWSLAMAQEQIELHEEAAKARARALQLNPNVAEEVRASLIPDPTLDPATNPALTESEPAAPQASE